MTAVPQEDNPDWFDFEGPLLRWWSGKSWTEFYADVTTGKIYSERPADHKILTPVDLAVTPLPVERSDSYSQSAFPAATPEEDPFAAALLEANLPVPEEDLEEDLEMSISSAPAGLPLAAVGAPAPEKRTGGLPVDLLGALPQASTKPVATSQPGLLKEPLVIPLASRFERLQKGNFLLLLIPLGLFTAILLGKSLFSLGFFALLFSLGVCGVLWAPVMLMLYRLKKNRPRLIIGEDEWATVGLFKNKQLSAGGMRMLHLFSTNDNFFLEGLYFGNGRETGFFPYCVPEKERDAMLDYFKRAGIPFHTQIAENILSVGRSVPGDFRACVPPLMMRPSLIVGLTAVGSTLLLLLLLIFIFI